MKRKHHAISAAIITAFLFNKDIAVITRNYFIEEEIVLVNPIANGVLRIELNFHDVVVAIIFLSSSDELAFDGTIESVKPQHRPMTRRRRFAHPKLVAENHSATL